MPYARRRRSSRRSYTRRPRRYRWRSRYGKRRLFRGKGFKKAVKKVILSTAESKYRTVALNDTSTTNAVGTSISMPAWPGVSNTYYVNHNRLFLFHLINNTNPIANSHPLPGQGNGDAARSGDEIYAKGFMLRLCLTCGSGHHNTKWRFWLIEWNTVQGNPVQYGELMHQVSGNIMLDTIQTDRWRAVKLGDYRYKSTDTAPDANAEILVKKWIPFRRKLCFKTDNDIVVAKGMKEVLSVVGVAYDSQNTSQEASIGGISAHCTLYYGDP